MWRRKTDRAAAAIEGVEGGNDPSQVFSRAAAHARVESPPGLWPRGLPVGGPSLTQHKKRSTNRVWMQPGSESEEAIAFCQEQGIKVVHDTCAMIRKRKW